MDVNSFVQKYILNPYFILFTFWGLSWVLMLAIGNPLIARLKQLKGMKWSPREDTPDSHLAKAGVPSMGGIGIIGSAFVAFAAAFVFFVVAANVITSRSPFPLEFLIAFVFPVLVAAHALLGFIDDQSKARGRGGLLGRQKLFGQVVLAVLFVGVLVWYQDAAANQLGVLNSLPSPYESLSFANDWLFLSIAALFLLLLVIGTSNAVNLTDGIDGLAAGLSVQVGIVFATFSAINNAEPGPLDRGAELFWMCLGGACLGFLAFNKHPAKVFMGDTGSLALGAALGAGAILTRSVFLLPFIGFIFYVEMFSVIAQVAYFKWTKKKTGEGKRIFRRAPLHHHFELGGWSEKRVVATFWAINFATSVLGLILWKVGILPRFP